MPPLALAGQPATRTVDPRATATQPSAARIADVDDDPERRLGQPQGADDDRPDREHRGERRGPRRATPGRHARDDEPDRQHEPGHADEARAGFAQGHRPTQRGGAIREALDLRDPPRDHEADEVDEAVDRQEDGGEHADHARCCLSGTRSVVGSVCDRAASQRPRRSRRARTSAPAKAVERGLDEGTAAGLALGLVEPADLVGQREPRGASVRRIRDQAEVAAGLETQGDLLDVLAGAAVGRRRLRERRRPTREAAGEDGQEEPLAGREPPVRQPLVREPGQVPDDHEDAAEGVRCGLELVVVHHDA